MLDRYTTGLLALESVRVRKNLNLSIQSDTFPLQLRENEGRCQTSECPTVVAVHRLSLLT